MLNLVNLFIYLFIYVFIYLFILLYCACVMYHGKGVVNFH